MASRYAGSTSPMKTLVKLAMASCFPLLLAGCEAMGTSGINLIPVEEEWQLGEQFGADQLGGAS